MITQDNILNQIGDTVTFKTVPLFNLQSLTGFSDDLTGLTATRTIERSYCYSLDGVVFTDYADFVLSDMMAEINPKLTSKTTLVISFMYARAGTDSTGSITLNEIVLDGVYNQILPEFENTSKTIFAEYVYDDIDVFNLMVNLTDKIYKSGIIPLYMDRDQQTNDLYADKDYIEFWSTLAKMYAILYKYSIQFTIIYWRRELLEEFLRQKTIRFCKDTSLVVLQMLAKNYYDEIRQRGTVEIFRPKGYEYPWGSRKTYTLPVGFVIQPSNPVFIDDVRYNETDELPFGWVIDTVEALLIQPDNVNYHKVEYVNYVTPPVVDAYWVDTVYDLPRLIMEPGEELDPTRFSQILRRYHGEYLRLICFCSNCDEFMFLLVNVENYGWNIGNSSPMYKGLRQHYNNSIIKGYENFSKDVWDLDYYPIVGAGYPLQTFRIKSNDVDLIDKGDSGHTLYSN